ncbi:hypothetical protein EDC18_101270 [Natranaerovirga pectinivora]|uniref:UPF0122 protein EDC18_101270 n=1 Tax=Natranaerovirga pectinivora TaxID=682400 RepID=A0A4R3MQA2_9FIRM|nr:YlxM family DNA-binding protein [Natranaerovirga pectinivora]TCT16974.1 hypothetical protein EDC18_101270 [Natranaerovirga pectinivora]
MEKIVEQTLLYDFYGELLTEKQKKIYECYFLNDLSLGEISEQEGISRQGVYDTIKRTTKLLENYENKLNLVKKFDNNKKRVSDIYEYTNKILNRLDDKDKIIEETKKIQEIADSIINDL